MCGSKGHAVVAANVGGQAALLKKPLKYGESVVFPGRRKRLTTEESSLGRCPRDNEVPCARRRTRPRRSTRPWRSSTACTVLLAGMGMPENLRIKRSRILRAPQLGG